MDTSKAEESVPLHSLGRSAAPVFDQDERLFRRYKAEHVRFGKVLPSAFSFPQTSGISFNRSGYSKPEHVLHADCCNGKDLSLFGVLEVPISSIPKVLESKDGDRRRFVFFLRHLPLETCFAHSEIWWCEEGGSRDFLGPSPPPRIRERFRVALAVKIRIAAAI